MRFYYFLTPSLTYSPPKKKATLFGRAPVGNSAQLLHRGSLRAHYLLYQPLQCLELSTGSTLMHPFSNFSRSSCLQRSWKKNPILLSPTTHLHSSCSSLWSPCSDRSLQQDWTHGLKLFCEKPGCSPTLWKTNFFFQFFPAWLLPLLFPPKHTILQNVHFCATTSDFLPSLWNIRNGHQNVDLGLFFRKSPHTYISW